MEWIRIQIFSKIGQKCCLKLKIEPQCIKSPLLPNNTLKTKIKTGTKQKISNIKTEFSKKKNHSNNRSTLKLEEDLGEISGSGGGGCASDDELDVMTAGGGGG